MNDERSKVQKWIKIARRHSYGPLITAIEDESTHLETIIFHIYNVKGLPIVTSVFFNIYDVVNIEN